MTNPVQYTSRTYTTVLNDINSVAELADKPNWWKRIIAGSHDVISMYENAIANNTFLRTSFTRQAVIDLCALIDYYLSPQQPSSGDLLFYLDADAVSFPKTVLAANLAARSQGSISVGSKKFEARANVVLAATTEGFTTDFATDNRLDVARVYTTGEKVRVATDGTLPSPLQAGTDYYAIYVSDTEITLAESVSDAFAGTEITLTSNGAGNHTITLYTITATCYQQETVTDYIVGESDGVTSWQRFDLNDLNVLEDTISVTIDGNTWTRQDTLVNSISTDKHFLLRYNSDDSSYILFGDGTYGAIPGNFDIYVGYATGGGINSNVSQLNKINIYAGSDSDVLGVANAETFTGGADPESIETAKVLAPILLKARDRFVTVDDGEALVLNYGGITRTIVNKNVYGILSCQVPIVPSGGGLPSGALKTALQTYLIDRTILESIDVRVVDPTYITVTPVVAVKILSGYTFANVQTFVELALDLVFSEVTAEYQTDLAQNGITSTIALINAKWSFSFTEVDYDQVQTLVEEVEPTSFGKTFQESDVLGYIDTYVDGVDYLTWSSPAFPITTNDDEITTENVLSGNITEIP